MNKYLTKYTLSRNNLLVFSSLFCILTLIGCYRAKEVNPLPDIPLWKKVAQFRANNPIQNLIGTPFEVYAITESEFARINRTDTLIEKRPLSSYDGVVGRPILDDNFFVRFTLEGGKDIIEFHSTRNPAAVQRILLDDLKNPTDNKIEIDRSARLSGAFNAEETQFVLLATVNFGYSAFYFDIVPNQDYDDFVSITPSHRIDLENVEESEDQLQVVRFLNGNYYVGTKNGGGYRLTEQGDYTQVLELGNWIIDFFYKNNRIVATNFNTFGQRTSLDNGASFPPATGAQESDLQETEIVGDTLFTHQSLGFPWKMVEDASLLKAEEIYYGEEIEEAANTNTEFNGIGYSNGKFYIAVDRDIYYVESVTSIEEDN